MCVLERKGKVSGMVTTEPLLFFSGCVRWLPFGLHSYFPCLWIPLHMGSFVGGWPSLLWAPLGVGSPVDDFSCWWAPVWLSFTLRGLPCWYSNIPLFSPQTHSHRFFFSSTHRNHQTDFLHKLQT